MSDFFAAAPNVEAVIPLKKIKYAGHWRHLWMQTITKRWDIVVDLRNSVVSRLVWANKRYIYGPHIDKSLHKTAQNAAVIGLDEVPYPRLWFPRAVLEQASRMLEKIQTPIIAVGPAANWQGKTWPAERFIEVLKWMLTLPQFDQARVAVIAAPGEEAQAMPVLNALEEGQGINLIAKGSPLQAAACLSLCDFYLGNDSGLMHAAAAAGVPTFGLFGPSYPHLYAPSGPRTAYAQTPESFDALIDYAGYSPETAPSLMTSLSVSAVKEGIKDLILTL